MNAAVAVNGADLVIDAVAVGLFLFASVFFLIAFRSLADATYLSIFYVCAVTLLYCALGLAVYWNLGGPRDLSLAAILVQAQDRSLSVFFFIIPYFWSHFLAGRPRVAAVLRALAYGGLGACALVWIVSLAAPALYIADFRFEGGRLAYRLGPLYFAMQAPYLFFILGSFALLLLGRFRWRILSVHWSFYAGLIGAVAFAASSSSRAVFGFYVDPLPFARFSRLVAALLCFGLFISYGFIRRFLSDAGDLRKTKEKLDLLLVTDALTRLPNRRALLRDLEGAALSGEGLAVLLLDLESFNDLNASFGTGTGDAILRAIGPSILPVLPPGAKAYRMGGDDFAIALGGPGSRSSALEAAERVGNRLKAGIYADGARHSFDCSMALSILPEDGDEPEAFLSNAFGCLREAKRSGARIKVYSREWRDESLRRIETVRRLRRDLGARRFSLAYQPIHDASGAISGAEALLRWDAAEEEIGPADFVPLLESAGLMPEMGKLAIDLLFEDLAAAPRGLRAPMISVNLSPAQLATDECARRIAGKIEAAGLPFSAFQFEVTESIFLSRDGQPVESLRFLRERGALVAIDDFGSGYSNLGYLGRLPADKLKIDKAFVAKVPGDAAAESLVRSLADIGRSFGLALVAEGVERPDQLDFLRRAGYGEFQGYYYSRGLPREAFWEYAGRAGA